MKKCKLESWLRQSEDMKAIDTNVLVRFLTNDDDQQTVTARSVIEEDDVFVSTTVVLETNWVLCSAYNFRPADVIRALRSFAGLPTVTVENLDRLIEALGHAENGMDFADALHLVAAGHCEAFLTFDRGFVRSAELAKIEVLEPQ